MRAERDIGKDGGCAMRYRESDNNAKRIKPFHGSKRDADRKTGADDVGSIVAPCDGAAGKVTSIHGGRLEDCQDERERGEARPMDAQLPSGAHLNERTILRLGSFVR